MKNLLGIIILMIAMNKQLIFDFNKDAISKAGKLLTTWSWEASHQAVLG